MDRIIRHPLISRLGQLLCLALLCAAVPAGAQGAPPEALVPAPNVERELGAAERGLLERIERRPSSARVDLIRFPNLQRLASGKPVRLTLAPGVTVDVRADRIVRYGSDSFTFEGTIEGEEPGGVILAFDHGQGAGGIVHGNDHYQVQWVGRGLHALIEVDPRGYPPEHGEGRLPEGGAFDAAASPSVASPGGVENITAATGTPVMRVLVFYTQNAAQSYGGNMTALARSAVTQANNAFTNSGVSAQLELAHVLPVTYTEHLGDDHNTDLDRFSGTSDIYMTDVHSIRNTYGADLMVLFTQNNDVCGRGYIGATAATAFATVDWDCAAATGYWSLAHELGHNAGARHDNDGSSSPYAYGHGKYVSGSWRTIMGIRHSDTDSTPRILRFSNPNITYNGVATGDTTWRNVARVWNERAATLAGFRGNPPCAAIPDYTRAWFPLDEASGATTVNNLTPGPDGTPVNGPTPVAGQVSNGLSFDGVNDYVQVLNGTGLDVGFGDFSVAGWIKTTQNAAAHTLLLEKRPTDVGSFTGYAVHLYNGKIGIQLADSTGYTNFESTAFVADNFWHHFAVTVDRDSATGIRFYLDGFQVGTANPTGRSGNLSNSANLLIGSRYNQTGLFQGILDEVQIFGKILDPYEVRANHAAGPLGTCRPLHDPNLSCTDLGPEWWCQSSPVHSFGPFTWQWYYSGEGYMTPSGNGASVVLGRNCNTSNYNEVTVQMTDSFGSSYWRAQQIVCSGGFGF